MVGVPNIARVVTEQTRSSRILKNTRLGSRMDDLRKNGRGKVEIFAIIGIYILTSIMLGVDKGQWQV